MNSPRCGEAPKRANWAVAPGIILLAVASTMGGLFGGPPLGDHEALVADCARNMQRSGDCVAPQFSGTPFIRKPPLSYWLVAAVSYFFSLAPNTGLPVTTAAARLPSTVAGLGTVLLLWRLASGMFGRRVGVVAAVVSSTTVFVMLFAVNATAEMVLTFCCTWAYVHFWFGITTRSRLRHLIHMFLFYFALGAGMLAKGPMPLAMVAVPLAVWWYANRSQRALARKPTGGVKRAAQVFLRGLGSQTIRAFTSLWVIPGILVFAGVFVPWMVAVAREHPYAWDVWNWQYLQRFEGDYADTRYRGPWYYIPIALGLLAPWTLALFEAMGAPWLRRFEAKRRGLFFAFVWGVGGVVVMSLMEFKKPYYVLPAMPGFVLLIAVVVDRFLSEVRTAPMPSRVTRAIAVLVSFLGAGFASVCLLGQMPSVDAALYAVAAAIPVMFSFVTLLYLRQLRRAAFLSTALASVLVFLAGWYLAGPALAVDERTAALTALDKELDGEHVADATPVYWADQRPDARLFFYYGRQSRYVVEPSEVVTRWVDRTHARHRLVTMALKKVAQLAVSQQTAYIILDTEHLPLLDRLPADARARIHIVKTFDPDKKPDDDDWVLITNAPTN